MPLIEIYFVVLARACCVRVMYFEMKSKSVFMFDCNVFAKKHAFSNSKANVIAGRSSPFMLRALLFGEAISLHTFIRTGPHAMNLAIYARLHQPPGSTHIACFPLSTLLQ